jgi:hypothetical protein
MPDAAGNIRGIALSGKAGEILEKIKAQESLREKNEVSSGNNRHDGDSGTTGNG